MKFYFLKEGLVPRTPQQQQRMCHDLYTAQNSVPKIKGKYLLIIFKWIALILPSKGIKVKITLEILYTCVASQFFTRDHDLVYISTT